jgi:hypothetical protein
MKRLLLLTCLVSITSASFSQINKGQWFMGGNAGFNSTNDKGSSMYGKIKSTSLQLSPGVGYFITDKLAAGARISLVNYKEKQKIPNGNFEHSYTQVILSPFVRYYFLPKTEKLNLFADAGYTYGKIKLKEMYYIPPIVGDLSYMPEGRTNGYYISAGPAIFLTPHTALELTLSYNYNKHKDYNFSKSSFMAGIGFQIHLGK